MTVMGRYLGTMRRSATELVSGLALAFAASVFVLTAGSASSQETDNQLGDLGCGKYRFVDIPPFDYRLKDVTAEGAKGAWDLDHFHTSIVRREMQKPVPYSADVMSNLDFALRHSRNHHEALTLLIQYELRGGNLLTYPSARCYLDWARRFTPDDSDVYLLGGNYFWKKGDRARAKAWYEKAIELNPESAEAHYNIGLFYVELKDYESARRHATDRVCDGVSVARVAKQAGPSRLSSWRISKKRETSPP